MVASASPDIISPSFISLGSGASTFIASPSAASMPFMEVSNCCCATTSFVGVPVDAFNAPVCNFTCGVTVVTSASTGLEAVGFTACCTVPTVAASAKGAIGTVIPASTGINSPAVGCIIAVVGCIGCIVCLTALACI